MLFKKSQFLSNVIIVVICVLINGYFACNLKQTCKQCIADNKCAWCIPQDGDENDHHCYLKEEIKDICPSDKIINPKSEIITIQNITGNNVEGRQLLPEYIKLSLRPNEPVNITLKFIRSRNYPLDLYFLLDSSKTLNVIRDSVSDLGIKLSDAIKELTDNFQLGFGTFVDKNTMPFTNTKPSRLKEPCKGCIPTYGFKNHLSFNNESTSSFFSTVNNIHYSGNVDIIEGGLDALVQVMVCKKLINWRNSAVHLIVLTTDNGFHIAGDGKLAGIIEPNDGQCHVNPSSGEYLYSLKMDYPSLSQINDIAIKENMSIIFTLLLNNVSHAEAEFQKNVYKGLENKIEGARFEALNATSEISTVIKEKYNEIVKSVSFSDNKDEFLDVKYFSKCGKNTEKETKKCDSIEIEEEIEFLVSITLKKCPENQTSNTILQIKPQGLSDILTIDIDLLCQCSCEKENNLLFQQNSKKCSFAGNLTCGICQCNNNRIGKNCECDSLTQYNINDKSKCINQNKNNNEICSNRGDCMCGICKCGIDRNDEKFSGKYCECSNYDCPMLNNKLCSNNGECRCGKCICNDGFHGEACECSTDVSSCENNGTICSYRGNCECGKCNCKITDGHIYGGRYCEECKTCFETTCPEIQKCLECTFEELESYNCADCKYILNISNDLPYYDDESLCSNININKDGCTGSLYYNFVMAKNEKPILYITDYHESMYCTEPINTAAISSGIIIGIILIGMIILAMIKLWIWRKDQIEYAKFVQQEFQTEYQEENPLYKSAITQFPNPMFQNKSE